MNMNRSGHAEVREPDWYSRSADRAKLSPQNTLETTEASLQNSLTSLNLDSMADFDHFSVRSMPVTTSNNNSIAMAHDAPWNESPQSFRTAPTPARSSIRSVAQQPPAGVSVLDHLQNSISSLATGGLNYHHPPVRNIVTEEYDEDDSATNDDNLEGSIASLRIADLNEMDATAHAGNVSRSGGNRSSSMHHHAPTPVHPSSPRQRRNQIQTAQHYPSSPQRSTYSSNSRFRSSPQRSSTGSIASRSNGGYRPNNFGSNNNNYNAYNNEPSMSTLGDDDDDDDDNLEIVKLLSKQVETLKTQLLDQQKQNQILQQQQQVARSNENNNSSSFMDKFLPNDSILHPIISSAAGSYGGSTNDYSDYDSFGDDAEDDDDSVSSKSSALLDLATVATVASPRHASRKAMADAETCVFGAIAALKDSFQKQQEQSKPKNNKDNAVLLLTSLSSLEEQQPHQSDVVHHHHNDNDGKEDDEAEEQWLMDELVLCELEAHVKAWQRAVVAQRHCLLAGHARLKAQTEEQASRIAALEKQAADAGAVEAAPETAVP